MIYKSTITNMATARNFEFTSDRICERHSFLWPSTHDPNTIMHQLICVSFLHHEHILFKYNINTTTFVEMKSVE